MISLCVMCLVISAFNGALTFKIEERIAGGKEVDIVNYPYQLSLELNGRHYCGATIISDSWALTSAQCIEQLTPNLVTLRAGSSKRESGGTVHQAVNISKHPDYDPITIDYDFALVKINNSFPLNTPGVAKTMLALREPVRGVHVLISGWGTSSISEIVMSKTLRATEIGIQDRYFCNRDHNTFTNRMICGTKNSGKDTTCQGDLGGPVYDPIWRVQVGIISWGMGCVDTNNYPVFSNVAAARDWINSVAGV